MRTSVPVVLLVAAGCVAGCTTSATPATAPDTTAATTTTSAPTTTTSRPLTTTTTLDRTAEIQAIFEDLERRRLEAIMTQDHDQFSGVYANSAYLHEETVAFEMVDVVEPSALSTREYELLVDNAACIAFNVTIDTSDAIVGGGEARMTVVLEPTQTGWGYSWVGEGWLCDGAHPLS